jgi:hypothetical protein
MHSDHHHEPDRSCMTVAVSRQSALDNALITKAGCGDGA